MATCLNSRVHLTMTSHNTFITGQAGAIGPGAHAHDMMFQQIWSQDSLDLPRLAEDLARLRTAMKQETEGKADQDEAIGAVAAAEKAAIKGDGATALRHLKAAGKWTFGIIGYAELDINTFMPSSG
jgi:hypothetical protein